MDSITELLDQFGASDDHIQALMEDTDIVAKTMNGSSAHELSPTNRQGCARALLHIVLRQLSLPISCWFHSVTLLDTYCNLQGGIVDEHIPAACTAIALIVAKYEGASASAIAEFVHGKKNSHEIIEKEGEILDVLRFRVRCPTLLSWLNIFLPRLGVMMSGNDGNRFFFPMCEFCMYYAKGFVTLHGALHSQFRQIAQGLIGMACVATVRTFGSAIEHPCQLPQGLKNMVLTSIDVDMKTWACDFATAASFFFHGLMPCQ